MLILKTVAHAPIHGYGIAQSILLTSKEILQVQQGSLYPALHRAATKRVAEVEMEEVEQRSDGEDELANGGRAEVLSRREGAVAALFRRGCVGFGVLMRARAE